MITAAKDISDEAFLDAIRTVHRVRWESKGVTDATPLGTDNSHWIGASIWDVGAVLGGHPAYVGQAEATRDELTGVPEKVVRAKAKRLIQRGLIDGCVCGCRGDFQISGRPATAGTGAAAATP